MLTSPAQPKDRRARAVAEASDRDSGRLGGETLRRAVHQCQAKAPLRPFHGSLNGVSGYPLHIRGEIELGTLEKLRTFAVVDRLHVHALHGTDALKAFRAVIDVEESVMTLKETGETIRLGTPRVEEMYVSRINSTVRLCPGGQALVVANIMGKAPEDSCGVEIRPKSDLGRAALQAHSVGFADRKEVAVVTSFYSHLPR
ncbi:hypothetical protein PF005_g7023 [Phytophthora fragariae]|uniref:Uncharacterized protein n=1 Tax=Phytophthora fragariae TaxID=53985 RepID=A0A6A3UEM0_9STRA|nr:hypothetical protein PF003_g18888 [Phytophthora fragariae]KAE8942358.1 hypothetical protein PF009_g7868 [Phytophthora fragariae]KAE9014725.1 hypothetical protein PF011_g7936 [Phytophthora fragariae]KAE9109745.1 hypothetical protein PF007_g12122 [Phytophthora fragariae]KAE9149282.1 hypothetical protein PF006_g6211 [Phytophthora fragariae]